METSKQFDNEFELEIIDDDAPGEAFASVSRNPAYRWAKFVLTDDQPNVNKVRIPKEEFGNLIKSGVFAPINMAAQKMKDGHEGSFPLGVIANLVEEGNRIIGLAALWKKERESDVEYLKALYDKKVPLNLSWEIFYRDSTQEDGIETLHGTVLKAATLVGKPAYAGRTQILSMASQIMEDTLSEEELKTLQDRLATLETENVQLKENLQKSEEAVASLTTEKETLAQENSSLTEYKQKIELAQAKTEKLSGIKAKFTAAGIERDEDYFVQNEEKLLNLDEAGLDFILQELVSFKDQLSTASEKNKLPDMTKQKTTISGKDLGKALREARLQEK